MTPDPTDEQLRVMVAELCGWKQRQWQNKKGQPCTGWVTPAGVDLGGQPPNYPHDLNACAEFEAALTIEEASRYWPMLRDMNSEDECTGHWCDLKAVGAVPTRQRCLAFVAVRGKSV